MVITLSPLITVSAAMAWHLSCPNHVRCGVITARLYPWLLFTAQGHFKYPLAPHWSSHLEQSSADSHKLYWADRLELMNAAQKTEQTWQLREKGDGEVIQKPTTSKKIHLLGFRGSDFCLLVISYNYHETFTSTSCLDLLPDVMIKHRVAPTWMGESLSGSRFNCLSLSAAGEEFKQKPWRNTVGGACSPTWTQLALFCIQGPSAQGGTTQCALGRQYQSRNINQENAHRHGQIPFRWMQFLSWAPLPRWLSS